jgi:hypothetical protein
MLRKDGLYISKTDFFVQDMYSFVQMFEFSEHCVRRCEVEVRKGLVDLVQARSLLLKLPIRGAWLVGPVIEFEMNYAGSLWSKWRGEVEKDGSRIVFTIIDPDHGDVAGEYDFVRNEVVSYAPG